MCFRVHRVFVFLITYVCSMYGLTNIASAQVFDLTTLDGSNGFKIVGSQTVRSVGFDVDALGKFNGDAFDDIAIGNTRGGTYFTVINGARGFWSPIDLATIRSARGFNLFDRNAGVSNIASGFDFNGDGFDDVVMGANNNPVEGRPGRAGEVFVLFGKSGGIERPTAPANLNGINGFKILGSRPSTGAPVKAAGDFNADGFDDLIIGGYRDCFVLFGTDRQLTEPFDLANLNGNNGFSFIDGSTRRACRGASAAGDFNADGIDDIILGTPDTDLAGFIVFGARVGFGREFDLASLDGSNGFRILPAARGDFAGESVSTIGDVNGDGISDVILGAMWANPNGIGEAGSAFVLFGQRQSFTNTVSLNHLDGQNGFRVDGEQVLDWLGGDTAPAGDVNGDGIDDFIIGRGFPFNEDRIRNGGAAYVVFGRRRAFPSSLEASSLDGETGFKIYAENHLDRLGASVSGAGDINGDGFSDIILGAISARGLIDNSGVAYVIFGKENFQIDGSMISCGKPDIDPSRDSGVFVWRRCTDNIPSGNWIVRTVVGGSDDTKRVYVSSSNPVGRFMRRLYRLSQRIRFRWSLRR